MVGSLVSPRVANEELLGGSLPNSEVDYGCELHPWELCSGGGGCGVVHCAGRAQGVILALNTKTKAAQCYPWSHENEGEKG